MNLRTKVILSCLKGYVHQPDMYLALSAYLGVTPNRSFLNSESFYMHFLKFGSVN